MTTKISLFLLLYLFSTTIYSQSVEQHKHQITNCLLSDDTRNWKNAIQVLEGQKTDPEKLAVLLDAQYWLIGYYMADEQLFEAKEIIDDFETNLSTIQIENKATLLAYTASVAGYKISIKPSKAVKLISESQNDLQRALQLEPNNPIALFVKANTLFFTPERYGGNQQASIQVLQKSFEQLSQEDQKDYQYYCTGAWLVRVYYHFDRLQEAREICETLLKSAPNFKLIKDEYLPIIKQDEFDKKWEAFLEAADDEF